MNGEHIDVAGIERAIGSLEGTVKGLATTTTSGFDGVNARLDGINGRVRRVEKEAALHVTIPICEKIRDASKHARGAVRRTFWLPIAVGVVCSLAAVLIAKLFT